MPVQYSYTSTPPMGRTVCTEPQCLYSRAIPLLPVWTVRTVQSLSACTMELYLYSPYGPYGLYRASVPVQYSYTSTPPMDRTACTVPQCLYSTAILLLPLMGRTACTEPQCLYSTAIPLLPLMDRKACTEPQCLYRVHFTFFFHPKLRIPVHTLDLLVKMFTMRCREFAEVLGAVLRIISEDSMQDVS